MQQNWLQCVFSKIPTWWFPGKFPWEPSLAFRDRRFCAPNGPRGDSAVEMRAALLGLPFHRRGKESGPDFIVSYGNAVKSLSILFPLHHESRYIIHKVCVNFQKPSLTFIGNDF